MLDSSTLEKKEIVSLPEQLYQSRLLTIDEVCLILRISRTTCWRLRKQGKLSYVQLHRKVLFRQEDIKEFILNSLEAVGNSRRNKRGGKQ